MMFVGTVNISAFVVTRMAAMGAELACSGGESERSAYLGDNDTIGQESVSAQVCASHSGTG